MIFPLCPKARQRRKEARPGELLSAALEVFAERGFAATKLDDVAKRAGVSKGTVYLYFESKEALFKAAVEAAVTPAMEAGEALAADDRMSSRELLKAFVFNWWNMVGATPIGALPKLLVAESGNFPELTAWFHDNVIRRALGAAASIIALGGERGDFRVVEPLHAARIVFAPMFSYLLWRHSFSECMKDLPEPDTYLQLALDLLVDGLATTKESPR